MSASIWGSQGFWWIMASTGFNFVLSYSAVEHQSQKENFSALWLCPKYCKWNCSSVRLWLCMNLNWMHLNAPWFWGGLFLVLIYVQELTCQHFVHLSIPCESLHAPDYVSVQPLQPCHELWGLTWRRIRNTKSRHVQVSGRKLIPWKGNSKSARHYVLHIKNALFL